MNEPLFYMFLHHLFTFNFWPDILTYFNSTDAKGLPNINTAELGDVCGINKDILYSNREASISKMGLSFNSCVILNLLCNRHLLDGLTHVQTHFHTILCMVWQRLRQARHTVVTVAKDFDPHTFIFLHMTRWNTGSDKGPIHRHHRQNLLI